MRDIGGVEIPEALAKLAGEKDGKIVQPSANTPANAEPVAD